MMAEELPGKGRETVGEPHSTANCSQRMAEELPEEGEMAEELSEKV
jgi:hypothetical protein